MRPSKIMSSALLLTLFALVLTDARSLVNPSRMLLSGGTNGVVVFKGTSVLGEETIDISFQVTDGVFVGLVSGTNTVLYAGAPKALTVTFISRSEYVANDNSFSADAPFVSTAGVVFTDLQTGQSYNLYFGGEGYVMDVYDALGDLTATFYFLSSTATLNSAESTHSLDEFKGTSTNGKASFDVTFKITNGLVVGLGPGTNTVVLDGGAPLALTFVNNGVPNIGNNIAIRSTGAPSLSTGVAFKDSHGQQYSLQFVEQTYYVNVFSAEYTYVKILAMTSTANLKPAAVVPSGPTPLGCFLDFEVLAEHLKVNNPDWWKGQDFTASRAFPHAMPLDKMTVASCAALALTNKSPYFGVEKGNECWFGAVSTDMSQIERFSLNGKPDDTACTMECEGDKSESCGGSRAFNLYSIVIPATQVA